jgi:uncharacterized membrane protein
LLLPLCSPTNNMPLWKQYRVVIFTSTILTEKCQKTASSQCSISVQHLSYTAIILINLLPVNLEITSLKQVGMNFHTCIINTFFIMCWSFLHTFPLIRSIYLVPKSHLNPMHQAHFHDLLHIICIHYGSYHLILHSLTLKLVQGRCC